MQIDDLPVIGLRAVLPLTVVMLDFVVRGGLDLGRSSLNFEPIGTLGHHRVEFQTLLVKPLALFLQEVGISDEHSSDLAQILGVARRASFCLWTVLMRVLDA